MMLSVLLRIQVPAPNAFVLLSQSNYFDTTVRRRLLDVGRRVEAGEPLAASLYRAGLLPKAMVALVQAAQRVHNLPWALNELGETMGERTVRTLRRISQFVAPLLVMVVGLLVGVVVVGMFMPVIDIVARLSQ
jgi:type II secretory pathway component PulF